MREGTAGRGRLRIPARGLIALVALVGLVAGFMLTQLVDPAAATTHPAKAQSTDCPASSAKAAGDATPFDGVCEYLDGREGVVQVALFDDKADRSYVLSNGDDTQYTASIVKADILAMWLRRYQRRGVKIPGEIPYSIKYLMQRMIQNSDNAAATALFYFAGGCQALSRFNKSIPLKHTDVACETPNYYGWGNTTTTALDQVRLMKVFAYDRPDDILGQDARDYARELMTGVQPDQRFGISCGPWGTSCGPPNYAQPVPGVTVALKNGWKTLPTCTEPIDQCPWQVNSTGWVDGQGRDYALTVLTTRDPVGTGGLYGFNYGIDTIQNVSELVWNNLD
jgi:hypothetical protein